MSPTRVATLMAVPIFVGVRAEVIAGLLDRAANVVVRAGDYYFREGDKSESMYVLERGTVSLLKHWGEAAHVLGELQAGECFGEMALLDFFPRSASVLAETECSAVELTTRSLYDLYASDPQQFAQIQMNIARELSARLRAADERIFRSYIGADDLSAPWNYVA